MDRGCDCVPEMQQEVVFSAPLQRVWPAAAFSGYHPVGPGVP